MFKQNAQYLSRESRENLSIKINNLLIHHNNDDLWKAAMLINDAMATYNDIKSNHMDEYIEDREDVAQNTILNIYRILSGGRYKPYSICLKKNNLKVKKMEEGILRDTLLKEEEKLNNTEWLNREDIENEIKAVETRVNEQLTLYIDTVFKINDWAYKKAYQKAYADNNNLSISQLQEMQRIKKGQRNDTKLYSDIRNRTFVSFDESDEDDEGLTLKDKVSTNVSTEDIVIENDAYQDFYKALKDKYHINDIFIKNLCEGKSIRTGQKNLMRVQYLIYELHKEFGFNYNEIPIDNKWMQAELYDALKID